MAGEIHENHAYDVTGVAIAMAGDHYTVAVDLFAGAADQIHGHFGPKRKRFVRSEL